MKGGFWGAAAVAAALACCSGGILGGQMAGARTIESFDGAAGWQAVTGPGTTLNIAAGKGMKGGCVRMEYRLNQANTYLLMTKPFNIDLPERFRFTFYIKRSSPDNNFEFKLIDEKGNTFMKKWYSFASVNKWKKVAVDGADIKYAWGPQQADRISRVRKIEFTVTGSNSSGEVSFDELELEDLDRAGPESAGNGKKGGLYPRWMSGEQAFWTMTGVPDDNKEILVCEDGTIEPHKRGFTLMPMLYSGGKLITRDQAEITQGLEDGYLPVPAVLWKHGGLSLEVKALAAGEAGKSFGFVKYTAANGGDKTSSGKLFLVIQPYQVFPPWQSGGGISLINSIQSGNGAITVNENYRILTLTRPDGFGAQAESGSGPEGNAVDALAKGKVPGKASAVDAGGFASGAIEYDFKLKPGESRDIYVMLPLYDGVKPPEGDAGAAFIKELEKARSYWKDKTGRMAINIPEPDIVKTFKANIAYNLITKDGPGLQPGSRSYDKSWMRDGGIAADALLMAGLAEEAEEFVNWFSGFQQESGEIPPIIDTKAADPLWEEKQNKLVEYDSQGEYIWSVMQCYRFTRDAEFLKARLANVEKAVEFISALRARTAGAEDIYRGILPESTSHEGYYMKHSYWDDLWALRGLKDAREMAAVLGDKGLEDKAAREYEALRKSLRASMELVISRKNLDYIPGCAELGDYDPTSTSGGVFYCEEEGAMPAAQLKAGFDRYYREVSARYRDGASFRFTPYELRNVPAFLVTGRKERALELLRFMLKYRRPSGWNHFAEVVNSDYRYPDYFGDMPHTWVGAEYIIAVRSLFAYEKGDRLYIAAGVDERWLEGPDGISVGNLPTHYGRISYTLKKEGGDAVLRISGGGGLAPAGGYVFVFGGRETVFRSLPAEIKAAYGGK